MAKSRASIRWVPVVLDNSWVVEYLTDPPGVLRVDPAKVRAEFRLVEKSRDEHGGIDVVGCQVRLADADGRLWQAESVFRAGLFLDEMIDLTRRQAPRWLCHAPAEVRRALRGGKMLAGAQELLDDRFYRFFYFDNTAFTINYKYAYPDFDVAHREGGRLLVKVGGLFGNWDPLRIEGPDGEPVRHDLPPLDTLSEEELDRLEEKPEGFGDIENLEPLVYEMDCRALLFANVAEQPGYENYGGESYEVNSLPIPVVFGRVRGKGEPQLAVTFHEPARWTPSHRVADGPAGGEGYREMEVENVAELRYLAEPGGVLSVPAGRLQLRCRLGIEPGSEKERFDVVRCSLRLADRGGEVWEGETRLTPEVFVARLGSLEPRDRPHFFAECEEGWRKALEEEPLLTGVRWVLEDGGWRHFLIGDRAVSARFDGQKVRFDVGLEPGFDGMTFAFVVRMSGLAGMWHRLRFEDRHIEVAPAEEQDGVAEREVPPIVFELPVRHLLFRSTTFQVDDGFWHGNELPIPVVFRRTGEKGPPGAGVRFEPW